LETLPKVLLIGDSIRMSYQQQVAKLLEGRAIVVGPADNCQFTLYTLASVGRWVSELGEPQIVHWNNGLHDVGHTPFRSPVQMPIDMYRANLGFILQELQGLTSRIIWATTTPVHPARPFLEDQWSWRNEEIDEYNRVASELMQQHGIPINDLHRLVWDNVDDYTSEDQLHLSEAGQAACARAVADAIAAYL
jgi:isoamyl acetate esterase